MSNEQPILLEMLLLSVRDGQSKLRSNEEKLGHEKLLLIVKDVQSKLRTNDQSFGHKTLQLIEMHAIYHINNVTLRSDLRWILRQHS